MNFFRYFFKSIAVVLVVAITTTGAMAQFNNNHKSHGQPSKPSSSERRDDKPKPSSKPKPAAQPKPSAKPAAPSGNNSGLTPGSEAPKKGEVNPENLVPEPVDETFLILNGTDEESRLDKEWFGGQQWISVVTNDENGYRVTSYPNWCVINDVSGAGFNLECSPNIGDYPRSGALEVRSTTRITTMTIHQAANSTDVVIDEDSPSAIINNVWFEKNIKENGEKKLLLHLDFNVNKLRNQKFKVYLHFFRDDNVTRLTDHSGTEICYIAYGTSEFTYSHWDDFKIYVNNNLFQKAHNFKKKCTIDIEVTDEDGNRLGYRRNCATVDK